MCGKTLLNSVFLCLLGSAIATAAEVKRQMRIFDIRFLSMSPPDQSVDVRPPGGILLRHPDDEETAIKIPALDEEWPFGRSVDGDNLIELIQELIAEDSWENDRNSIDLTDSGALMVVQTRAVLEQIEAFLEDLYARSLYRFIVELALVPPVAVHRHPAGRPQLPARGLPGPTRSRQGAHPHRRGPPDRHLR